VAGFIKEVSLDLNIEVIDDWRPCDC
jgi:hypothetical protein